MGELDAEVWRARPGGPGDAGIVAAIAAGRRTGDRPVLIGVTGGVAAGKSTLAEAVAEALDGLGVSPAIVVATDGFLLPNVELDRLGLSHRKGFPETFDNVSLAAFLVAAAAGAPGTTSPVYSHLLYDVLPDERTEVDGAAAVVVEGLHLGHPLLRAREHLDLLVHLDAADDDLEAWFLQRFRTLLGAAADEPGAFLHGVTGRPSEEVEGLALAVWRSVNVTNLVEEVRPAAGAADLELHLGPDHRVERAVLRLSV